MGRYDTVGEFLDRPVPDAMFETRYGLLYLYARGRFSLATGHPTSALRDRQACGELVRKWELDVPGFIPWRIDAAEACLRVGRQDQARQLVESQLRRCGPAAKRVRGHGHALALLATANWPGLKSAAAPARRCARRGSRPGLGIARGAEIHRSRSMVVSRPPASRVNRAVPPPVRA